MADDQDRNDGAELQRRRAAIDALDRELLHLISERARHAQAIGALKNGPAYRPEREAQVLRRVQAENDGPLSDAAVGRVFREVMSACLALEQKLSVAYLGPPGTYSHAAVTRHFGDSISGSYSSSVTWRSLLREIQVIRGRKTASGGRTRQHAAVSVPRGVPGSGGS